MKSLILAAVFMPGVALAAPDVVDTVSSSMPELVASDYLIDFDAMDADGDGFISRPEVAQSASAGATPQARANLLREFHVVDTNADRRVSRIEAADWLVPDTN